MNVLLWVLQSLLAVHTVAGGVWKFSNAPQTVPALRAIPHTMWLTLSAVELLCAVALVVPAFTRRHAMLAPIAAGWIAAEMLLLCGVSLRSGAADRGELVYWLVVAAFSVFIVWGRLAWKPALARRAAGEESAAAT